MIRDLVVKSRSFRGYDESRRVTRDELLELVDCARFAPSSVNRQPFQYLLIWEKEEVDRLQPLTGWARGLPDMKLPHPGKCPTAFIVICQNTEWDEDLKRYSRSPDDASGRDRGRAWPHHDRKLQPGQSIPVHESSRDDRSDADRCDR